MTAPSSAQVSHRLFPPAASDVAHAVDLDLAVLVTISAIVLLVVGGLILWFGWRYRAGAPRSLGTPIKNSRRVEIAWTIGITLAFVCLFAMGGRPLLWPYPPPQGGEPIYIVAKQWMWKVQHPEGRRELDELHLPLGEPVRLVLTSQDVIHSFFVPAFRIKQDALPDRFTLLSFTPTRVGTYHLFCAEYCGSNHSRMIGTVTVMTPEAFKQWLSPGNENATSRPFMSLAEKGAEAFTRFGCGACHTADRTDMAPRLDGLYGRETKMNTGQLVIADDNYIRQSILRPNAKIVAGYDDVSQMPSFEGQVSEEDLLALIEFIRSVRNGYDQVQPEESP